MSSCHVTLQKKQVTIKLLFFLQEEEQLTHLLRKQAEGFCDTPMKRILMMLLVRVYFFSNMKEGEWFLFYHLFVSKKTTQFSVSLSDTPWMRREKVPISQNFEVLNWRTIRTPTLESYFPPMIISQEATKYVQAMV